MVTVRQPAVKKMELVNTKKKAIKRKEYAIKGLAKNIF